MKKFLIVISLVFVILLTACNKENDQKIKTVYAFYEETEEAPKYKTILAADGNVYSLNVETETYYQLGSTWEQYGYIIFIKKYDTKTVYFITDGYLIDIQNKYTSVYILEE